MPKGNQGSRRPNPANANRTARVGELVRRIVAEELDLIDDDRLVMVSITSVVVDRDLHKAVIWFTTLDAGGDAEIEEAFEEHRGRLRKSVSSQARLRKTPELEFRVDDTLRAAERIETLLRSDTRPPVPDLEVEAADVEEA